MMLIGAAAVPLLLAGGVAVLTAFVGQSCTGGGVGDDASPAAARDIPANMLAIYEQVGAQYKLPWEILAGIGKEECDQGLDPDPSCTPQHPRQAQGRRTTPARRSRCRSGPAAPPATSTTRYATSFQTRRWALTIRRPPCSWRRWS
jgi:predicted anti-sigma-YlaC factor YlaD